MTKKHVTVYLPVTRGKVSLDTKSVICQLHDLGWAKINRESKFDWGTGTLSCRDLNAHAKCKVCGPSDLLNTFINDILNCLGVATTAAGLAAIISDGAAAYPAFKAAFDVCLEQKIGDRINEITVTIWTENETTDWGPC